MAILSALSKIIICYVAIVFLSACQMGYLVKSGYYQAKIFARQIPVNEALTDPTISEAYRSKMRLSQSVLAFAQDELGLETHKNYSSFSKLDGPYVTYAVTAARPYKLEPFLWSFPIVGSVPYKGYFDPEDAREEEIHLKAQGLDTYVRGVRAYSTLGWFRDPLLSSMLTYSDEDLANTLIHETVHANIYIKNAADFNEQLATFLGNVGAERFFQWSHQEDSVSRIHKNMEDDKLFSTFISSEIKGLEKWYEENQSKMDSEAKQRRLQGIQENFRKNILNHMKTHEYDHFAQDELNNAKLIAYKTYVYDLGDFEVVFNRLGKDFKKMLAYCKSLVNEQYPEKALRDFAHQIQTTSIGR